MLDTLNVTEGNKTKVRWMVKNKCWCIPFNCCFVIKTIEDFVPSLGSMKVQLTMIMRIKFTGLPNIKYIMDFCAGQCKDHDEVYHGKKFMCRVNEEEGPIFDDSQRRLGTVKYTKSSDFDLFYKGYPQGIKNDMLQFTMRSTAEFKTKFDDESIINFSHFPFDRNLSEYRFELSHFEM